MYRIFILLFSLTPIAICAQDLSTSTKQKAINTSSISVFGTVYSQDKIIAKAKDFLSAGHSDPVLRDAGKVKNPERLKSMDTDSTREGRRQRRDLLRLYNLGNAQMIINVTDNSGQSVAGTKTSSSSIDLRKLPQGRFDIEVTTEKGHFTSTYNKKTDALPDCEVLDTSTVCNPDSFMDNIIGVWTAQGGVRLKFNPDGTYEELRGEILSNGIVKTRNWYIEDGRLFFDVGNATFKPKWTSFDCHQINFSREDFIPDFTFERSTSCLSDDILKFSGAYPVIEDETERSSKFSESGIVDYTFTMIMLKDDKGTQAQEYILSASFIDNDHPDAPKIEGPNEHIRFTADEMTEDEYGLLSTPEISINAIDILTNLNIDTTRLTPGDEIRLESCVILEDGRTFCHDNAPRFQSVPRYGGAFHISLPILCDSNLRGTFEYTTTETWCDSDSLTGTVRIQNIEESVYSFDDWSFGAYQECHGFGAAVGGLEFTDACGEVSFTEVVDSFGDTWTFDSNIQNDEWTITWSNTYGESGKSVIYYPDGEDWPISLAE